ncbi:MAG: hypothetical protein NUV56_04390 [Candidatus Uhrbacteria bacterium]|nr:hypothetical protein [Candidatus Uhrbacteria bacterium]
MGGRPGSPVVLCTNGRRTVINPRGKTRLEIVQAAALYQMRLTTPKERRIFSRSVHRSMRSAVLAGVKAAAIHGRIRLPPGCTSRMPFIIIERKLVYGIAINHPEGYIWWFEAIIKPEISESGGIRWYAKIGDFINERDEFDDPYEALVCAASMLMIMGSWR